MLGLCPNFRHKCAYISVDSKLLSDPMLEVGKKSARTAIRFAHLDQHSYMGAQTGVDAWDRPLHS